MKNWKTALGDAVQGVFFVSKLYDCIEMLGQQPGSDEDSHGLNVGVN